LAEQAFLTVFPGFFNILLVSTSTSIDDITQYMNYVSATSDSSWSVDSAMTGPTVVCDSSHPCLKLHNGATIYSGSGLFNGTETTRALSFLVDPDGKVTDGTTNGPGKSVQFFLYYNGRLTSRGQAATGTVYNGTTFSPNPNMDPPWFSW
jgi:hypothetical protein